MSFRFRRSIKLFPGVRINIGKRSISTSVGVRGAHLTFSKSGTYLSTGIPGTGISQRVKLGESPESGVRSPEAEVHGPELPEGMKHHRLGVLFWLIIGTVVLAIFQIPQLLAFYWLFILGYVVVRALRKKGAEA